MPRSVLLAGDKQEESDERHDQHDGKQDEERSKLPPVELGELLEVLDHHLAAQLGLALGANTERERNLGDAGRGDLGLEQQVERDLEAVGVERAGFRELREGATRVGKVRKSKGRKG